MRLQTYGAFSTISWAGTGGTTYLTARIQLAKQGRVLAVPPAYMLVLCAAARGEDTRDVRVPRKCLDGGCMRMKLEQIVRVCGTSSAPAYTDYMRTTHLR